MINSIQKDTVIVNNNSNSASGISHESNQALLLRSRRQAEQALSKRGREEFQVSRLLIFANVMKNLCAHILVVIVLKST